MKLLELYILRRVVQMFLTALLPVLAIIWTTQVLGRINLVTDSGQSIGSFMKLATLILPTIIPAVMPFALVIGITQTLTTMNNDSELAVIDAAGAPRMIIWRPIILLAIALSTFSFVSVNFVEPKLRLAVREMIAAAYADLLSTVIEEKSFRKLDDGLYVQISERHSGRVLKGLFVADMRDPASDLIYYAREGAVDESGTALIMRDGEVQRKSPEGTVSIVRFDSYSFDLSELASDRGQTQLYPLDRDIFFLWNPDPNDKDYQFRPLQYHAELHRRLSYWSFSIIFALVSLVYAGDSRSHRQARLHPMAISLAAAVAIYGTTNYMASQAEGNPAFIPAIYAVPAIVTLVASAQLFLGWRPRSPRFAQRAVEAVMQSISVRMGRNGAQSGGNGAA